MRKYKVGDYISSTTLLPFETIKTILYGKIVRIIGEIERNTWGSVSDYRKLECLPDFEFDEEGNPPETFCININDIDDELTIKMNRDRKIKELLNGKI